MSEEFDFEAKYAELRALAKEQGSELDLSITVGGIRINERYLVTPFAEQHETLEAQLDQMEGMLRDPRHEAAAKATRRMVETEGLAKAIGELVKTRQDEYGVAIKAFRRITTDDTAAVDSEQEFLTSAATIARDPDAFDVLLAILDERQKPKAAETEEPTD